METKKYHLFLWLFILLFSTFIFSYVEYQQTPSKVEELQGSFTTPKMQHLPPNVDLTGGNKYSVV